MTNKSLGFIGAALLFVGLFLPVVNVPIAGSMTLMSVGLNWYAFTILFLGTLSVFLIATDRIMSVTWTGGATLLLMIYAFARLQYTVTQMLTGLSNSLRDSPFSASSQPAIQSEASSAGLLWGCIVLTGGAALLTYAAIQERRHNGASMMSLHHKGERLVAAVSALALLPVLARDAIEIWLQYQGG